MSLKTKTPEELLNDLQKYCFDIGWEMAIDMSEEGIYGVVVGTKEYVQSIILQLSDEEQQNFKFYEGYIEIDQLH